jgi:alcohol dehydrogenase (NADP+)
MNIAGGSVYPLVPGHECVGIVATIGEDVTELRIGDTVGVGPVIDSCGICENCKKNNEYLCEAEFVRIVGGKKSFDRVAGNPKTLTAGAFSGSMVVHENFVIKLPAGMNLERTAPLLASGLTVYEPLKKYMKLGSSVRA